MTKVLKTDLKADIFNELVVHFAKKKIAFSSLLLIVALKSAVKISVKDKNLKIKAENLVRNKGHFPL